MTSLMKAKLVVILLTVPVAAVVDVSFILMIVFLATIMPNPIGSVSMAAICLCAIEANLAAFNMYRHIVKSMEER